MIELFLPNKRIAVFLEQIKNRITANTLRASQLLEEVISSESSQMATFWLKDFFNTNLKIRSFLTWSLLQLKVAVNCYN